VPLANLWNVPRSDEDWQVWSTSHRDHTNVIRQAIRQRYGINLPEYQLDPIPFDAPQQWLAWNQGSHDDIDGVLGTQGSDLEDVDFTDANQVQAWIFLHVQEHTNWTDKLGVS